MRKNHSGQISLWVRVVVCMIGVFVYDNVIVIGTTLKYRNIVAIYISIVYICRISDATHVSGCRAVSL